MQVHPIYTEDNNCQDCYKCVRECPVKAIKIENHHASIIPERCIYCGHCTIVCPSNAKKVREDIKTVNYLLENNSTVVAALAPSYLTEFSDWGTDNLLSALKQLGFTYISETALGAEMVSKAVNNWLEQQPKGVYISSCCPTVVDIINKYYPHLKSNITPITTPMLAHGSFIKEKLGKDTKVVFIGPCIAKKKEAEKNTGSIDAVITFQKLREWFQQKNIHPEDINDPTKEIFYPQKSDIGSIYPIDGGMLTTLNIEAGVTSDSQMCFSGLNTIIDLLENFEDLQSEQSIFLELMACSGGCINGPVTTSKKNTAIKRTNIISNYHNNKQLNYRTPLLNDKSIVNKFDYTQGIKPQTYTEAELNEALQSFGKYHHEDELNCNGCGYNTCKDFAKAILDNVAEPTMCVSFMRETAQRQATILMQKIPYAVVMVDDKLVIRESNKAFASLMGEDIEIAFEHTPMLTGYQLKKLFPDHRYFSNMISSGSDIIEKDLKLNNKNVHLSLFSIQKHKLICGMMHSFNSPEILKTEITKRSKQVIKQNLKTVQKIALLLGENASQTEAMLNSLVNIDEDDL